MFRFKNVLRQQRLHIFAFLISTTISAHNIFLEAVAESQAANNMQESLTAQDPEFVSANQNWEENSPSVEMQAQEKFPEAAPVATAAEPSSLPFQVALAERILRAKPDTPDAREKELQEQELHKDIDMLENRLQQFEQQQELHPNGPLETHVEEPVPLTDAQIAWQQIEEEGFEEGDAKLHALADKGDPEAQWMLGMLTAVGLGRKADAAKALVYYNFAAMSNTPAGNFAKIALSHRALTGVDVPKDCAFAQQQYQALATESVFRLLTTGRPPMGVPVVLGDDVDSGFQPQPVENAIEYHDAAAAGGDAQSSLIMAQLHYYGDEGLL